MSLDDEPWQPSRRLLDLAATLAAVVADVDHPLLAARGGGGPKWFRQFPGEHYNLLTALCRLLKPAVVWEFGTDTGMSTVALLEGLQPEARLYTVDIDGWRTKTGAWLLEDDFSSGRVTQLVCDMNAERLFEANQDALAQAELIFIDGPKDGATEASFLAKLDRVRFRRDPIVVFDDIRLMNMVHVWRGLGRPKMDMTSFGHWSGTGLVDWRGPAPDAPHAGAASASGAGNAADARPPSVVIPADRDGAAPASSAGMANVLMLCHEKPNYIPDLLLHGLRKLLGAAVVDYPRKDALYDGCLGQPYLDRVADLMAADDDVDRSDIAAKTARGFYDLVLCDIRAIAAHRPLLADSRCPLALIDGEDHPARIKPGNYVILRRETDGFDYSVPLPMSMPVEVLDWIERHADAPKTHSIAFLGSRSTLTPARDIILDDLRRHFPDALLDAWEVSGGNWRGRDAYYRAMQSCKAVLNLPGAGFDTFRYWENAACNAAHVAMRMPLLIPDDFRDDREILRFSDFRELAGAIERVLSDRSDWRELAGRSRARLRAHHMTDRRAAMTLDRVNAAFLR